MFPKIIKKLGYWQGWSWVWVPVDNCGIDFCIPVKDAWKVSCTQKEDVINAAWNTTKAVEGDIIGVPARDRRVVAHVAVEAQE